MSDRAEENEMDLSLLLDGELAAGRRAEVEARIRADPRAAARLESYRADKEKLRRIFEAVAQRPIPREWLAVAEGARSKPKLSFRMIGSIAAALLVVIIGAVSYVELRRPATGGIVQEALDARQEIARPEKVIAVASGAVVERYSGVLRSAVGSDVKIPDMSRMGYRLASIRVFSRGAAEMAYRDRKNGVVTIYVRQVRRSDGEPQFYQFGRDGLRVCVWQDDRIATVIAGNVSTALMQRLADVAVYGLFL
jgi:anti-sigma factor RsiW